MILAAIAVPNFLESQVRSKVSRSKADMRSLATAIESYMVDNNQYPPSAEILWQGPVKYITSGPQDPYALAGKGSYKMKGSRDSQLKYVSGQEAIRRAIKGRLLPPDTNVHPGSFWMSYSIGPDLEDNFGEIIYDSTNGTTSVGDIIRTSQGGSHFSSRYSELRDEESEMEVAGTMLAEPRWRPGS